MKKKILSVFLAIAMMAALVIPAMAADPVQLVRLQESPGSVPVSVLWQNGIVWGSYDYHDWPVGEPWNNPFLEDIEVDGDNFELHPALSACQFEVTLPDGTIVPSFCTDLGAADVDSWYDIDPIDRGVTDEQKLQLMAVLDYVNDNYGLEKWTNYPYPSAAAYSRALAQVLVWSIVEQENVSSIKAVGGWGVITADVEWILDNCVEIYEAKLASLAEGQTYVSGLVFLIGAIDSTLQRQVYPLFDEGNIEQYEGFSILKTVDGIAWDLWTEGYSAEDLIALLDSIGFELYAVSEKGAAIDYTNRPYAVGNLDPEGYIVFENKNYQEGWYAVVEVLGSPASDVFDVVDPLYIYIDANGNVAGNADGFDYNAFYTIVNGYGGGYTLGYPGLNNSGDIFPIAVQNGDKVYDSFCANGGSRAFAGQSGLDCSGYVRATSFEGTALGTEKSAPYEDFVSAYNYIYDTYGDLSDYRAVTQIVTWYLLGSIEYPSDAFNSINWNAVEEGTQVVLGISNAKEIVEDVITNYNGYKGDGAIVSLVLMVCEKHHEPADCQPQLVPVYDGVSFNNKTTPPFTPVWSISLDKTVDGAALKTWLDLDNIPDDELLEWINWFDEGNVTFEIYHANGADGQIVGDRIGTPVILDTEGKIVFTGLEDGWYAVKEVLSEEAAKIFEAKPVVYFQVNGRDVTGEFNNTELLGSIEISTSIGQKFNMKDSITGGYSSEYVPDAKGKFDHTKAAHNLGILDKNTWFQYNDFTNGTGGHFDLVNGDKLTLVGGYTITNDGDGWFTITADDALEFIGARVSISNTIQAAKNTNDKAYNPNNIWTTAPGQQQFSGSGHSFKIYAPWVDTTKKVFVYIHLEGLQGYKNNSGVNVGDQYLVEVFDASGVSVANKTIVLVGGNTINGSVKFDGLKPGDYTVKVNDKNLGTYTIEGGDSISDSFNAVTFKN